MSAQDMLKALRRESHALSALLRMIPIHELEKYLKQATERMDVITETILKDHISFRETQDMVKSVLRPGK